MSEVFVVGIRVEISQPQPVLLLKEISGERHIPIWIGRPEAEAITLQHKGIVPDRPMTHDLLVRVIEHFGHELQHVQIVDLVEGTFFAELVFDDDSTVSCRASDAVAVAMRLKVSIFIDDDVLDETGLILPEVPDTVDATSGAGEAEVEKFKEFLNTINPEDFAS